MPQVTPLAALRAFSRLTPRLSRNLQHRQILSRSTSLSISASRPFSSSFQPLNKPLYESPDPATQPPKEPRPEPPSYQITFTCTPCSKRSTHRISKQGYHLGSVLITCPECRNRHVISDHLKIFGDASMTIEDLMRETGQLVKKGTLSEDGDIEFWEDGTSTKHVKPADKAEGKVAEEGKLE